MGATKHKSSLKKSGHLLNLPPSKRLDEDILYDPGVNIDDEINSFCLYSPSKEEIVVKDMKSGTELKKKGLEREFLIRIVDILLKKIKKGKNIIIKDDNHNLEVICACLLMKKYNTEILDLINFNNLTNEDIRLIKSLYNVFITKYSIIYITSTTNDMRDKLISELSSFPSNMVFINGNIGKKGLLVSEILKTYGYGYFNIKDIIEKMTKETERNINFKTAIKKLLNNNVDNIYIFRNNSPDCIEDKNMNVLIKKGKKYNVNISIYDL
jgi:hypothetical protein